MTIPVSHYLSDGQVLCLLAAVYAAILAVPVRRWIRIEREAHLRKRLGLEP